MFHWNFWTIDRCWICYKCIRRSSRMVVEKWNALPTSSDGRKNGGFVREESIDMCI